MQVAQPDVDSWRFRSLDTPFFYHYSQNDVFLEAIYDHNPLNTTLLLNKFEREIEIECGDLLKLNIPAIDNYTETFGNIFNGYTIGINQRTIQDGIFPSFKVKELAVE